MRIEYLKYYLDIAETQSIKRASEMNFISPQGLSRDITVLEKELKVELLNRSGAQTTLTSKGRQLLPHFQRIVDDAAALRSAAEELAAADDAPRLRLYCCTFVFIAGIAPLLRQAVEKTTPHVTYLQANTDELIAQLIGADDTQPQGEELGIVTFFSPSAEENAAQKAELAAKGLIYRPYLRYSDRLLVSREHPFVQAADAARPLDAEQVAHIGIISSSREQRRALQRHFGRAAIHTYVADMAFRTQLVCERQGAMLVPPFLDVAQDEELALLTLASPYSVEIGFVGRRETLDSKLAFDIVVALNDRYRPLEAAGLCRIVE